MIITNEKVFLLQTKNTSYMFRKLDSGHLEHLHYGDKIFSNKETGVSMLDSIAETIAPKHFNGAGNTIVYSSEHNKILLEQLCLEMSSFGKGDIRDRKSVV